MKKIVIQSDFVTFDILKIILKLIIMTTATCVLIGWYFNIEVLKSINPSWIAMRVNTAFCFLMSVISITLMEVGKKKNNYVCSSLSKICAAITGLFGILTILEFFTGISNGIDSFLYAQNTLQSVQGTLAPGRMAANTSLNFILASIALFLLQSKSEKAKKASHYLALAMALISMPALIGYSYGAKFEGELAYFTQMAIHTSIIFIMLSIVLSLSYLESGFMAVFAKKSSGGLIARRLLPLIVVIPFFIDYMVLKGLENNFYGFNYAMTLAVIVSIIVIGFIVFRNALIVSRMEEELLQSHMNLEKTVEKRTAQFKESQRLTHLGSWEWTPASRNLYWSDELYRIFNLDPKITETTFETYFASSHPDDRENIRRQIELSMKDACNFSLEHRIVCDKGSIKYLFCQGEVIAVDGVIAKIYGTAQDITLQKNIELELIRSKEVALSAVIAKSDFLSNMSHEIRTPMNAIVGMADLLSETMLTEEQDKFVQTLKRAGDNLLIIINDILDFSKLESADLKLEEIEFDLNEVIESTSELLAPKAHAKRLDFISTIKPDVPTLLVGDPHRLRQVLTNLLSNSIKFTSHGEIILKIEKNKNGPVGSLTFSVTDTGIGIPEGQIMNLFERFTQVDTSVTRKFGGTGLGLSISKKIVKLMNGEMSVESVEGKGSCFSFSVCFGLHQNENLSDVNDMDLNGVRALVVDDNESDRTVILELLNSWGAITTDVDSGEKALEILKGSNEINVDFDLLLLDQRMPGITGFEVFQEIKDNENYNQLVTMMITSDDRSQMINKAQELGITNYLIKPVKRKELWNSIAQAYQKSKTKLNASSAVHSSATESVKPLKILLVDDSEDNRTLIIHYLKKLPYELVFAHNGQQAVDEFLKDSFDIILMDMQMPIMDGYTATKVIRDHEIKMNLVVTPIVALTAFALHEDENKSLDAGCNAHLTKPIKKQILQDKILELTRK